MTEEMSAIYMGCCFSLGISSWIESALSGGRMGG